MGTKHQSRIARPTLFMACAGWFGAALTAFIAVFILVSPPFSWWALLMAGFTACIAYRFASFATAMTARFRTGLPPADA